MKTSLKIAAAALLTVAVAVLLIGTVSAQPANPEAAAAESLCDYCADYTDAATSAGTVQSAYRPVVGYAAVPSNQAATAVEPRQDRGYRIQMYRVEKK